MTNPQSSSPSVASEWRRVSTQPSLAKKVGVRRRLIASLLLLSTIGYLYNNLAIVRLGEFTIDASHLFLLLAAAASFLLAKRLDPRIVILWLGLLCLELIHALLFGLASDIEWIKSAAQVGAYSLAFVIIAGLKLQRQDLMQLGRFAVTLTLLFGGFAILQFVLLNTTGVELGIPNDWRSTTYSITFEDYRYQGVARAQGLSREPAELAFGLVILLAFLLLLQRNKSIGQRSAFLAILVALGGIIATLSPTGILAAGAVILGSWLLLQLSITARSRYILAAGLLVLVVFLVAPLSDRFTGILQGTDVSAAGRLIAPAQILVDIPSNAEFMLLGTGLGLETRNIQTYLEIYQPLIPWMLGDEIRMHNILAVIKFQQGALGLLIYLTLLWVILRPTAGTGRKISLRNLTPVIILVVMFLFSSGYYASPIHWSLLAFVAVLSRSEWQSDESRAVPISKLTTSTRAGL